MHPDALKAAKHLAATDTATPSGAAPNLSSPNSAGVFNGLNGSGLSAAAEGYQPTPPDSTGAIGPTRYVEMVNQLIGVYDRNSLSLLSSTDLGTFSAAPSGTTTTDVQVQWDPQGNRWFAANISFSSNFASNFILFGWSKTSDPSDLAGGWCHYAIATGGNIPDFPKLGHDGNFVMISDNVFDSSKPSLPFVTADLWAIPKPAPSQSTCSASVTSTHFADATHPLKNADGTLAGTVVPTNTFDAFANGYIVSAHDASTTPQSKVMVWQLTPGPTLVARGDITVGTYAIPPSVPQPGTSYLIDSLDARFTQAVALFDPSAGAEAVWAQHTVANAGRSMVRWYEFLPGSLTVRQQGQLASTTDFYWNAAISPSAAGSDAMIEYNRGSASSLPIIGAQTRTSSTPLGQMDAGEALLAASSDADQETLFQNNCSVNPCRWGDYSGASPDPGNPGVVWGTNQFTGPAVLGLGQWQTENFAVTTRGIPPAPPVPPTGLSASAISSTQINLSWTGSSTASSYKVQRSADGSTGWSQVGTSTSTSFSDNLLNPSTTYFYRVLASNNVGDSGPSNVASATTQAGLGYGQGPQGNWVGTYGNDGYVLLGWNNSTVSSLPQSSLVIDQGHFYEWASSTSAVQALESPDTTTRHAATFTDDNQARLHLSFTTAYSGTIHLYALDWDTTARRETITVDDGSGPRSATISTDFSQGAWVNAPINVAAGGTVTITVTHNAGLNAVLEGIFLGGAPTAPAPPTGLSASPVSAIQINLSWTGSSAASSYKVQRSADGSTGWSQVGTSSTTSFSDSGLNASTTYFYRVLASNPGGDSGPSNVASATTAAQLAYTQAPQGNWVGTYGGDGYALFGWNGTSDLVALNQCSIVIDQGSRYQWNTSTTLVQVLESPDTTNRRAATFYDPNQARLHLSCSSAYSGVLHLYALDWDTTARRETITVDDGSGLRSATISTDFSQGAWVNAPINVAAGGTVTITLTRTAGQNAVLAGLFLGGPPTTPGLPYTQAPQGNWVGTYGKDGYVLFAWNGATDLVSLTQCSVVVDKGSRYLWNASTTSVQALESPDTTTRHAATLYDPAQASLHLSFTTAYSGTLHLYALDWDSSGRREIITVNDGSGPRTATISTDFSQGAWVNVPINVAAGGTVTITVTQSVGPNAVLAGIFLG